MEPTRRNFTAPSCWSFIRGRFRRIPLPYYCAALIISIVLATTLLSTTTGKQRGVALPVIWQSVVHLLSLQDIASSVGINHVFWSVALELHLNFIFPLFL